MPSLLDKFLKRDQPLPRDQLAHYPKLASDADHPKAWTFPEFLRGASTPWVRTLEDLYSSPLVFPAAVSPEVGLLLHALVLNTRPRTVVETGTFIGISTIWMAAALNHAGDGHLHTFDLLDPIEPGPWRDEGFAGDREAQVRDHLTRAGVINRVTIHKGDSAEQIDEARPALHRTGVQLALIDGDHAEPGVLRDFHAVEPALATGGYLVLHDTNPDQCGDHAGPRRLIELLNTVADGRYERCELWTSPLNYGLCIARRVR